MALKWCCKWCGVGLWASALGVSRARGGRDARAKACAHCRAEGFRIFKAYCWRTGAIIGARGLCWAQGGEGLRTTARRVYYGSQSPLHGAERTSARNSA
eukprot:scaffold6857_cov125-Isochrysis_galbana.AAC.1